MPGERVPSFLLLTAVNKAIIAIDENDC
jgi:hypothetical protein